jgi:hypothetical protein
MWRYRPSIHNGSILGVSTGKDARRSADLNPSDKMWPLTQITPYTGDAACGDREIATNAVGRG